jgi:hypothetical protein
MELQCVKNVIKSIINIINKNMRFKTAWIGRQKYGKAAFQKLSQKGRKK